MNDAAASASLRRDDRERKRVVQADDMFFQRHPDRQYRIRRASPVEIRQKELNGGLPTLPAGWRWFLVLRDIAPGRRLCLFIPNLATANADPDEDMARGVFEYAVEPYRDAEQRMEREAEAGHETRH